VIDRRTAIGAMAAPLVAADRPYRIELLWKTPEGHPNAMESTPEGLWIVEQQSDNAYLLDWKTGKPLHKIATESHNTSGVAYGGGALWLGANGKSLFRERRPTDRDGGEIVKADPKTGKTLERYPIPDGGGVHGVVWDNGTLWMTCFKWKALAQVRVKDWKVSHQIPVEYGRAHGLALDGDGIWCVFSNDYLIQKLSRKDGKVLDQIQLARGKDPDPHGADIHEGLLHYCDAGMQHPNPKLIETPTSGYVCRIHRG
jgi:sugar lactone lactonase YvrE